MNKCLIKENLLLTNLYTITKEKTFLKQPQFESFYKKETCLQYLKSHKELHLFSEDLNSDMAKRFIAIDYKTIYLFSIHKKFHLYENYEKDEMIKFHLDI